MLSFFRNADWLTPERVWRISLVAAAVFLAATLWDFATHLSHGVMDATGEQLARDFVNYWTGPRLLLEGKAALAYDVKGYIAYQKALVGTFGEVRNYSYPPQAMLLTLPLAWLDYVPALALWTAAGIAWCAALLSRFINLKFALIAAVGAPAAFFNTVSGQNGQFTAALLCGGLMLLERRPILAGLALGCLCYKPHLGVLLPVALAAAGHWRAFFATGATAVVLVALSTAVLGPDIWAAFLRQMGFQRLLLELGDGMWVRMPTTFGALRSIGAGLGTAYAAQIVTGLLAAFAVALAWRGRAPFGIKASVLVLATFLATPYAWDYDLVALTFVVVWIAIEAGRTRFLPYEKLGLALLTVMPFVTMGLSNMIGPQIGPIVLALVLAYALKRALSPAFALREGIGFGPDGRGHEHRPSRLGDPERSPAQEVRSGAG